MIEQEMRVYWKTVMNTIKDGLMIVDRSGTILSINKALEEITGYTKDDLIGHPCSMLNCDICEIARDRKGEHWCTLFSNGSLSMRKCTLMRNDGSYIHILKNASLLRDSKGNVVGAVETLTDITEIIHKDDQIEAFERELRAEDGFHRIIGASASMQKVFDQIADASKSDAPVIIFGESGTGKDLVAKAIHVTGNRRRKPFVKVNCAALNESLLESELFGHVKGAFTGAYRSREGRFEAARGGDIFLDEIGDLPLSTQVKLLRVLEEKVIERVGQNKPVLVDVRIISATNKDLKVLVQKGLFREDLLYRINVIPITIPPLRDRVVDLPLLIESFFRRVQMKSASKIQGISNDVLTRLLAYHWPGNVRELKSTLEYAFISCHEAIIQPYHLPPNIINEQEGLPKLGLAPAKQDEIKKRRLMDALEKTGGNQSEAARLLGVSRVTIWKQMKKFNINLKRGIQ
ncbi:MAG: sigma 54-interacting transcriptional regulator [Desulfobacteraceae bacterium]|jgi:PAS domain S-box-containing protein